MTSPETETEKLKKEILEKVERWHEKCNSEYPIKLEFDKGCVEMAIDLALKSKEQEITSLKKKLQNIEKEIDAHFAITRNFKMNRDEWKAIKQKLFGGKS